jgi:tetratricopeptide (TPR) repeat protein
MLGSVGAPDRASQVRGQHLNLTVGVAALIVVATFVAYAPALSGSYFGDDHQYILTNPTLRSAHGLWQIWFEPRATPQYYPMVFTTFWVEYHLWGAAPFGYHVTNVALHALSSLLLWAVLSRLRVPGAVFAAAVFALHPVHAESVAWITERKDTLCGTFYLLTVLAWLGWMRAPTWPRYTGALALFGAAMLSKTIACTLPVILLLVTWWQEPSRWRRALWPLVPFLAISLGLGMMTTWREHLGPKGDIVVRPLSLVERGLLAGRVLWFYAGKIVWPANFMRIYPRWEIDAHSPWQYAFPAAAIAVLVGLWAGRRRLGSGPLVAVLFFAITLGPVLGFAYFDMMRLSFVADHLQYLASIGLIALGAGIAARLARHRRTLAVGGVVLVMVLGLLTWREARLYTDAETLWRDTLAKNPQAMLAHNALGTILATQGKLDEAIEHFRAAARIDPHFNAAQSNWGTALDRLGRPEEALQHFEEVLRINPGDPVAHYNIGTILGRQGQVDAAIAHLEAALRRNPNDAPTHTNLGALLAKQGRLDAAIQHFREALRIDPQFAVAQTYLERTLAARNAARSDASGIAVPRPLR